MTVVADGFGGISNGQLALIVGVLALIWTILRWRKMTIARQKEPVEQPMTRTHTSPLSVREVTTEIQALLADLEETSRRLAAQLDNRYQRLEYLMAEADEKIERLEALTGRRDSDTLGRRGGMDTADLGPTLDKTADVHAALTDAQRTLARLRQERGAPPAAQDPAYEPIYALADRGRSSREIAKELGRQPGEIELILALRQRAS